MSRNELACLFKLISTISKEKPAKTPNDFIAMAKVKGFDNPKTKAGDIISWLKEVYGLGRGHAMAIVHIIKNGAEIGDNGRVRWNSS